MTHLDPLTVGVLHEVKNHLVSIRTFFDLFPEQVDDPEFRGNYYEVVRKEVHRLQALTSDFIGVSQKSDDAPTSVSLHELLTTSARLLQPKIRQQQLKLLLHTNAEPDTIRGHRHQLAQVFFNLLINAAEACEPGAHITVTTENIMMDRSPKPAAAIAITICDTGSGISLVPIERIFEEFVTTKPNGSGIGLAMSKTSIDRHHGTISVDSKPGAGTTFTICLPREAPDHA